MFKRPPKGAGLAQHVAKDLRATQSDICCCQSSSAIASDNGLFRIFCDVVMRSNPGQFHCHKIGELRICYEIYQATTGNVLNKYRYRRRNLGRGNEIVQRCHPVLIVLASPLRQTRLTGRWVALCFVIGPRVNRKRTIDLLNAAFDGLFFDASFRLFPVWPTTHGSAPLLATPPRFDELN